MRGIFKILVILAIGVIFGISSNNTPRVKIDALMSMYSLGYFDGALGALDQLELMLEAKKDSSPYYEIDIEKCFREDSIEMRAVLEQFEEDVLPIILGEPRELEL